ncbi:DUF4224 domain-containing protein [Pseudomonas sp. KCJK8993]|uniref:DUF4224 domain-containing protein n=1 Tax=Pseudomonas sp. KCJK8993 TaxID=3344565 RepID=UPI0039063FB7
METEILSDEELTELTGYKARAWQRRWLDERHWHYIESRGKRPLVGRLYARIQLGVPTDSQAKPPPEAPTWKFDLSRVR